MMGWWRKVPNNQPVDALGVFLKLDTDPAGRQLRAGTSKRSSFWKQRNEKSQVTFVSLLIGQNNKFRITRFRKEYYYQKCRAPAVKLPWQCWQIHTVGVVRQIRMMNGDVLLRIASRWHHRKMKELWCQQRTHDDAVTYSPHQEGWLNKTMKNNDVDRYFDDISVMNTTGKNLTASSTFPGHQQCEEVHRSYQQSITISFVSIWQYWYARVVCVFDGSKHFCIIFNQGRD